MNELLLLNLSEDGDVLSEFLESLQKLSTALGEGLPVDIGFLPGQL